MLEDHDTHSVMNPKDIHPKELARRIREKECPPLKPQPPEPPECVEEEEKVPQCRMVPPPPQENVIDTTPPFCVPAQEPCTNYHRDLEPVPPKPCDEKCPPPKWARKIKKKEDPC